MWVLELLIKIFTYRTSTGYLSNIEFFFIIFVLNIYGYDQNESRKSSNNHMFLICL